MDLASWLAFSLAYLLMAATPGPVTLLVTSYAIAHGRRTALSVVIGTVLGDSTCMIGAAFGLGAVIAASAAAFTALKLAGAAYLVFLGMRMWRSPFVSPRADVPNRGRTRLARMLVHAYLTTVLNPKAILFFMIFLPQFLDARVSLLPQVAVLLPTVLVLGAAVDSSYALAASSLRRFTRTPRAQKVVNRACGGALIGEGIAAAAWRGLAA